jgi:hypothetical protein
MRTSHDAAIAVAITIASGSDRPVLARRFAASVARSSVSGATARFGKLRMLDCVVNPASAPLAIAPTKSSAALITEIVHRKWPRSTEVRSHAAHARRGSRESVAAMKIPVSSETCLLPSRARCSEATDKLAAFLPLFAEFAHVCLGSLGGCTRERVDQGLRIASRLRHE